MHKGFAGLGVMPVQILRSTALTSPMRDTQSVDGARTSGQKRAAQFAWGEDKGSRSTPDFSQARDGFFLVMQPIMSLRNPTASLSFEVLLRSRSPAASLLLEASLKASGESDTISAIDKWVITWILEWLLKSRDFLGHIRFVCVSVSDRSCSNKQFLKDMLALFERFRQAVPYLCFEITERAALNDIGNTQDFISLAHRMGGKVALSAFGSEYTSFKYMRSLQADAIKIDGEFIRTMCAKPFDSAIVNAIATLARDLGMRSVAESVEDLNTLRALTEIGVDYVQGPIVSMPQESDMMLIAPSAASFVKDPDVVRFIENMEKTNSTPLSKCSGVETKRH